MYDVQATQIRAPEDRFAKHQLATKLRDVMTEVLHDIPHTVAWSYAHKMKVSDVLFSEFTKQIIVQIKGCTIETKELIEFLYDGMRKRGVKEAIALELQP